ncbi:MAG: hypothetical protein EBR67_10515 [Proteobacteria bacterium]|jgi:hypothetical protein|nr:hypothetical protein [Pseudomonadota bacterium]
MEVREMKFTKIYLVCSLFIIITNAVSAKQQIKTLSLTNMNLVNVNNPEQMKSKQALQNLILKEQNINSVKFLSGKRKRALENYINGEWSLKVYDESGKFLFEYIALIEDTMISKSGLGAFSFTLLDNTRTGIYSINAGLIAGDGLVLYFSLPSIYGASLAQIFLTLSEGYAVHEVSRDCIFSNNEKTEFSCKNRFPSEVINGLTPLTMEKIK